MSEPKTVQGNIIAWGRVKHDEMTSAAARKDFADTVNLALGVLQRCPILDFHIIPGTDVVVTAEGREAAGRMFWERTRLLRVDELNDVEWDELSPCRRIELTEEADCILKAAGITCVELHYEGEK